ncbi:Rdx family-domain-containing protein [Xylaria bambusicola]|uniref:Rdx family-domain-containing protein n=1 Tax=Xylaria bambusicola TaxID=326684 RepID=UPI002008E942|nr:Rdx family-domain-containing protein [Xylaria bambusicola]KAI0526246.1 Rdx family-domain-containing protein [Xylaria bambusicola]
MAETACPASTLPLPRITIRFCTQCKWMLRAAYFAQELLSTFSTSLGEVALQPATGGVFVVEIHYADSSVQVASPSASGASGTDNNPTTHRRVLWDRKIDGGFPETKELKRRVRDVIEPGRNLGHVDRDYPRQRQPDKEESKADNISQPSDSQPPSQKGQKECEDCQ